MIDPEAPLDGVFKKTWADRRVHGIAWPGRTAADLTCPDLRESENVKSFYVRFMEHVVELKLKLVSSPRLVPQAVPPPGPEIAVPEPMDQYASYPAQVIIYHHGSPQIYDGTAMSSPDAPLELIVPINPAPPAGLPVQVIVYTPIRPTVHEGTTGAPTDEGSIPILLP